MIPVASQRRSVGRAAADSGSTVLRPRCWKKIASAIGSSRRRYNAAMLAEAMCKLMGFTYAPSQEPEEYWRHGHSTETDFIYVTTQSLTHDALRKLSEEVGPKRTLLVCCKAFSARESAFPNLTIKKIPQAVLSKCEWGRDDYSLRVASLPAAEEGDPDIDGG